MRNDTRYEDLDSLDDYQLEHKSQDIRGRPLVSPAGEKYGMIEDLLVSRDHSHVSAVRLDNGVVCAIEPLIIHDKAVVYGEEAEAHARKGGKADGNAESEQVVPIVEEKVAIGKRVSDHGRNITVTTKVVKDRVNEDVHLRDETVSVEKRPVNRSLSSTDADTMLKGKSVSMTERDEEVVVGKSASVTDEVVLSKKAGDRVEHVDETARRTEVKVDDDKGRAGRR